MARKVTAYGWTDSTGKLNLANRRRFVADLFEHLRDSDIVLVAKRMGKRSIQQNRYYFGCVVEEIRLRLKEYGYDYDRETVHEFLKQKFNGEKIVIEATGEVLEIGQTTTEFNKDEMSEYIERIRDWAAVSLDLQIPDASTQTQMQFSNDSNEG